MNSYSINNQFSQPQSPHSSPAFFNQSNCTSVLNAVVVLQEQPINVFGVDLFELHPDYLAINSMREAVSSHALSQAEPLNIRKMNCPEASLRAKENWSKAFSMVRQLVKGAFKDCLVIKESYYLEALDPRHEYMAVQKDYFEVWNDKCEAGSVYSNYFQFLELYRRPLRISDFSADGRLTVRDDLRYITDDGNRIVKPWLLGRSWVFTGRDDGSQLATGIYQCSPEESQSNFGMVFMRGKIVFSSNHYCKAALLASPNPSKLIFVSDENNVIYAGIKIRGVFHHSSFLSGRPVSMAGSLIISPAGELLGIDNYSGHYKPTADHCYHFLFQLGVNGVDLKSLDFKFWNQNLCMVFQGSAVDWMCLHERGDFDLCW